MQFVTKGASGKERYFVGEHKALRQVSKEEFDRLWAEEQARRPPIEPDPELIVGTGNWKKPVLSDALAVHPDQIPQVMERNRLAGVHVEYEPQYGRPILRSSADKKALMRLEKCHDNNCYN
jgi:hypothetical protein